MKGFRGLFIVLAVLLVGVFAQPQEEAHAAFHLMRIHAVMGGFNGDTDLQYVELRMTDPGQNFVEGHHIRFYAGAGTGTLTTTFSFSLSACTSAMLDGSVAGRSILIGSEDFAANATVTPDCVFTTANTDPDDVSPVPATNGMVCFGDAGAGSSCVVVDAVAYGTATPDPCCGPMAAVALPTTGNQALTLKASEFCFPLSLSNPCADARSNSNDYELQTAAPRNNDGTIGSLISDADQDGVADGSDNCMTTANAFQGNQDADGMGDACDPDSDADGTANATDNDDDNDGVFDSAEGECRDDVDSADANTLVNDGCPASGTAEGACSSSRDSDGDGYVNDGCPGAEVVGCGGDPLSPSRRPERIDGAFAATDDDADGSMNEALPAGSSGLDCDGDGWPGNQENLLYFGAPSTTRDQDPCGNNGWPADLAVNNTLNIGDIGSFTSPNRLGDNTGTPPSSLLFNMFSHPLDDDGDTAIETAEAPDNNGGANDPPTFNVARWNLQTPPHLATTKIDIGDLNSLTNGLVGSPARPPMFNGLPAFFTSGGMCPWPA